MIELLWEALEYQGPGSRIPVLSAADRREIADLLANPHRGAYTWGVAEDFLRATWCFGTDNMCVLGMDPNLRAIAQLRRLAHWMLQESRRSSYYMGVAA
jgi:hypothetical protein